MIPEQNSYRIAIDVGGTFTDCVVVDEASGALHVVKVSSTPADPAIGFMHAMERALSTHGIDPQTVSMVIHATTVATNAILERRLSPTAFVVTRGFGDMLEIGRQIRPKLYDLDAMKPVPLVPRHLVLEVGERLASDGSVVEPLSEDDIDSAIDTIAQSKVEAVVVCLLNSYLNPEHELRVVERIKTRLPDVFVSASSEVSPQIGEFARACTALVNAGLVPHIRGYVTRLRHSLKELRILGPLQIMKSDGGLLPADMVAERPVEIIESGPAAGVVGAAELAKRFDLSRVICFDMGGTTAKAGLLIDGEPILTPSFEVGDKAVARVEVSRGSGYPIKAPVIDLVEVGAGGGSIAWIDNGGVLRVGPRSGGADPGPVCYGRGATEPTVTDANVVLGRIDPDYFLGGAIKLDYDAAWKAIEARLAIPLGMSVPAAALGVLEIANATMLAALRMVSVQRGFDARDFTLICSGGAAALQADALMKQLGVVSTFVPPSPGVGTARGMLFADMRREYRTHVHAPLEHDQAPAIQQAVDDLLVRAKSAFTGQSDIKSVELDYAAELCFAGQSHELRIGFEGPQLDVDLIGKRFREEHRRRYGFAPEEDPVELVELVITSLSRLPKPKVQHLGTSDRQGAQAIKGHRRVWLRADAAQEIPIYDRALLMAQDVIASPAIIEAEDSTILVGENSHAVVDMLGNIIISQKKEKGTP